MQLLPRAYWVLAVLFHLLFVSFVEPASQRLVAAPEETSDIPTVSQSPMRFDKLPPELLSFILDKLPVDALLRFGLTNRHMAALAINVMAERRKRARASNKAWADLKLPISHSWYHHADGLGLSDATPIHLNIPTRYLAAKHDELLPLEDAALGDIRTFNRLEAYVANRTAPCHTFTISAIHGNLPAAVEQLKQLDRLEVASRRQVWHEEENRLEWPNVQELLIQHDDFAVESPLPRTVIHFDTHVASPSALRALRLPPTLKSLNLTVPFQNFTAFDQSTMVLPSCLESLCLKPFEDHLALVNVTHLPRLKHLRVETVSPNLSFNTIIFSRQIEKQLETLKMTGDIEHLPPDFATRFPRLETFDFLGLPDVDLGNNGEEHLQPLPADFGRLLPPSLRYLRLAGLYIVSPLDLSHLANLTEIELSGCGPDVLKHPRYGNGVQKVTLMHNRLRSLAVDGTSALPANLKQLEIRHESLDFVHADDLPPHLQVLVIDFRVLPRLRLAAHASLRTLRLEGDGNQHLVLRSDGLPSSLDTLDIKHQGPVDIALEGPLLALRDIKVVCYAIRSRIDLSGAVNLEHARFKTPPVEKMTLPRSLVSLHMIPQGNLAQVRSMFSAAPHLMPKLQWMVPHEYALLKKLKRRTIDGQSVVWFER